MVANIVCVLNRSPVYDTDYADRLLNGVADYLDRFGFLVIYGSKWPGWWAKMEMFSPDVRGDILYFDLDTVIVGPINELFTGKLTVLADFNAGVGRLPKNYMASGVMYLPEEDRKPVWDYWIKDPQAHMRKHGGNGDGGFLSQFYKASALRWQDVLPGKIVSYKLHCKEGVPQGASVVCFHGQPRPREVNWKV